MAVISGLRCALLFLAVWGSYAAAQQPAADSTALATLDTYALGPGDKLRIIVFGEPSLSGEFNVSDTGKIAIPLIGGVDVQGKSVPAAQEMIRAMLADGYLKTPQVSLEVLRYRPYYIYGEVVRAGEYPFASGLNVQQAIAAAGGYSYRATRRYVFVKRSGKAQEERLDFRSNPVIAVLPGDTLRIGERHF